jgi:hypothetical protein
MLADPCYVTVAHRAEKSFIGNTRSKLRHLAGLDGSQKCAELEPPYQRVKTASARVDQR